VIYGGRRRRRRLRAPVVLVVALVAVGALAWVVWPSGDRTAAVSEASAARAAPEAPARHAAPKRVRRAQVRVAPLLHRGTAVAAAAAGIPVRARGAILVDAGTGTVLWAKAPHRRLPIASTTKIMTALVALERLAPHDVVVIHPSVPRVAPFREGLRAGERVEAWKLLYGLLLFSGNDDALALAIGAAGSRGAFVHAMNVEARLLGLRDSHFRSPSGLLDVGNYSSAWDLAALTRYALRNPRFRAIVRTRVKHVTWAAPTYEKIYVNKNHLLGSYRGADGVKTGWTTLAKHCLVASARRQGVHLVAVALGSDDAYADVRALLDWGFARV
jgi:D-alanyl-D-alanine carboxypeptidase